MTRKDQNKNNQLQRPKIKTLKANNISQSNNNVKITLETTPLQKHFSVHATETTVGSEETIKIKQQIPNNKFHSSDNNIVEETCIFRACISTKSDLMWY